MMLQMLAIFAEHERATIIDRMTSAMERKAAAGGWNGGASYGYQRVGQRTDWRLTTIWRTLRAAISHPATAQSVRFRTLWDGIW